jgi:uncharacterized protein (DUF433 family)
MTNKYTESNPKILNGICVIKGTRVPVDIIFERLIHAWSWEEVLEQFPDVREVLNHKEEK